jgi:membrane protein
MDHTQSVSKDLKIDSPGVTSQNARRGDPRNEGVMSFEFAKMHRHIWELLKETVYGFLEDEALTRGAAIAFYTITSIGPVLFIVVAIAGLFFGEQAARGALAAQLGDLLGQQSADLLQTAVRNAAGRFSGLLATLVGIITLIITASGVFTEMQQTLNVIWRAVPPNTTLTGLLRARALSLGLVAALGFLLLVSLVISTILAAVGEYVDAFLPSGYLILRALNIIASFALITLLFAGIYKVLPDRHIEWRDVLIGAIATSVLFTIGKILISLYLGSSTVASSYGAAGGLIIALLWVYYSAQTFLLGAEFTKVYTRRYGSRSAEHAA